MKGDCVVHSTKQEGCLPASDGSKYLEGHSVEDAIVFPGSARCVLEEPT